MVTSGGFTAAYLELVPQYESTTHNKLSTEFGPSMGTTHNAIPVRLDRGERIDVVIMAAPALQDLIKQGKVRADSRVDLIKSYIGMAVKAGAPKPDISTVDALNKRCCGQIHRLFRQRQRRLSLHRIVPEARHRRPDQKQEQEN